MAAKSKSDENQNFEESLKKLEAIIDELESNAVPLDSLLVKYEEAKRHLETCRKLLQNAELKIKQLSDDESLQDFKK